MVGPNVVDVPVDDLSTDDKFDRSDSLAENNQRTVAASAYGGASGNDVDSMATQTAEDDALDGVPQEVIRMIGAYDTDCAGGCG